MLKVHETTLDDGSLASVFLGLDDGTLVIRSNEGTFPLPEGALAAVMDRYAAPLETSEPLIDVGALELGAQGMLRHVRHLARYDVIARDYLVYAFGDGEPVCALAATVARALAHLGRAASVGGHASP